MQAADPELHPFVVAGFLIAFALAFGIGANDVANSFGTSVGSKVLTLRQACILASVFEILGAILIGGKVSATIREGIMDPLLFRGNEKEYCLGLVASLAGCCIWMLMATYFKLPVSGTHSIVGSTMGFALVSRGSGSIRWRHFSKIVASWFISPLLSGSISVLVFLFIRRFILYDQDMALIRTLRWLPVFYCVTILINVLSVLLCGPSLFWFNRIPLWSKMLIVTLVGFITLIVVQFGLRPRILRHIKRQMKGNKLDMKLLNIGSTDTTGCRFLISDDSSSGETKPNKEGREDDKFDPSGSSKTTSKKETFTIEPAELPSQSKQVQVDYIALLSDATIPAYIKQSALPFWPVRTTVDDYCLKDWRSHRPMGEQSTYATYGHPDERSRLSTRFAMPPTIIVRSLHGRTANDITLYAQGKNGSGSIPVAGRAVIFKDGKMVQSPSRSTSPGTQSCNASEDEEYDEQDEIQKRVRAISSVKSQHKRDDEITETPEIGKLFSFLQILTAVFGSFAHGGNDVSNAIGPLISLWLVFAEGNVKSSKSPVWVLFYGGVGIIVGLWVWGRRVIKTIGEDLTKITPSTGFVIEVSTAFTVLFASNLSIPVSTTHCKVGSVVFTGRVRSKQSVDWSLFGNIIIAWLVTVPVTGILSAALTALFRNLVIR